MRSDIEKNRREKDAVDELLRRIAQYDIDISILRQYVQQELPQVACGNRMDMRSMLHVGKMGLVAILVSQMRFKWKIRWGDLMNRLNEDIVHTPSPDAPTMPVSSSLPAP